MKRPLVVSAFFIIVGILMAGRPWTLLLTAAALLSIFCVFTFIKFRSTLSPARWLWLPALFLLAGFFRQELVIAEVQGRFLKWDETTVSVIGTLADAPRITDFGITYDVYVQGLANESYDLLNSYSRVYELVDEASPSPAMPTGYKAGGRIRAALYDEGVTNNLEYGQQVLLTGEIRLPEGQRNPGGFNSAMFLAARGISGTMVLDSAPILKADTAGNPLRALGIFLKTAAINRLESTLPSEAAPVMAGLLLGETAALDPTLSDAFRTVGLSHVLSVSGANVAFLLLPFMWLLKKLGINRRRASAAGIPLLLLYVLVTGFDASISRAALMAIIMLIGGILWRKSDFAASLSCAMLIMLTLNSAWLFDTGFRLSFLATASIGLFCENWAAKMPTFLPKVFRETLAGTLAAQLGVLPILVGTFNTLSLIAVPINLVVVPLIGVLTVSGALLLLSGLLFPFFELVLAQLLGLFISTLCRLVLWTAQIPLASIVIATPPAAIFFLYVFWVGVLRFSSRCLGRERRREFLPYALIFTLFVSISSLLPNNRLYVTVADVGQGDAILISTPRGRSILVDGGGHIFSRDDDRVGERIVLPLLRSSGRVRPDIIVSTHSHVDHLQGLETVARKAGAGSIVLPAGMDGYDSPGGLIETAGKKAIPIRYASGGDVIWQEPNMSLTVVSPNPLHGASLENINDASLVLLLSYFDFSMLLTGDIGSLTEYKLAEEGKLGRVDVLKVSHHGSDDSTTREFLNITLPQTAVISAGRNRYGHPSPKVLERLEDIDSEVHITKHQGAWKLRSNGKAWAYTAHLRPSRTVFSGLFKK